MTQPALNFKRGGDEASEAAKSQRGGGFRKTHYFGLADGETEFLRYITDWKDLYFVKQHQMFPTGPKPADYPGDKWPEFMGCTCRYDDIFGGAYKDCYPCDHPEITNKWNRPYKATVRNWVIAIIREEVVVTDEMVGSEYQGNTLTKEDVGTRLGFRDATREVEIPKRDSEGKVVEGESEKVTEPAFVMVNMADNNYFDGLGAMKAAYGTICDRDYLVRCSGEGKDKSYTHAPMNETPNLKPGTEKWKKNYLDKIAEIGESLDIEKIIAEKASDDFHAKFIDRDKTFNWKSEGGGSSSSKGSAPEVPDSGDADVDEDALKEMRARIRSAGGTEAPTKSAVLSDVD